MSAPVYKWRPQANIKIDAKVAGQHLEKLRVRNNGQLTPRGVLDDAADRRSPLHKAFIWDDSKAAHEHRLWQARHLINSIVVVVKGGGTAATAKAPTRAFVSVTKEKSRHYTSRAHAMSEKELRLQLVEQGWRDLLAWRDRFEDHPEFAVVVAAIDKALRSRKAA